MAEDKLNTDNITSGPIVRTIISLAIPVVLGMFMEFALTVTDFYWVGKLGPTAQDSITTSMVVIWTIYSFVALLSVGVTALVSRFVGARDFDRARFYISQGLQLAVFLGLIFSLTGFILAPTILRFMGPGEATLERAIPYLRIFMFSCTFYAITDTTYAVFRASGDTRTPTKIGVMMVLINMGLDPVFIFGLGPFPEMGVAGASVASAISIFIAMLTVIYKVYSGRLGYPVDAPFKYRPDISGMLKIIKIGLPISFQQFVFIIVYWFLIKIVHEYGEAAGAAMGIGNRMESLSYLTCYGFSLAASTMVGQNLGAKNPDRAAKCAWGATGLALSFTCVIAFVFVVFNDLIAGIFTNDAEVRKIAADYLFILGLSQFTMAVEIVIEGSFSGAGNTIPPMLVLLPGAVARIPLAYYLCFSLDWGINGVWWTLTITTTFKALILAFWFRRGRWKLKQV
ncbi:MAG: MATE family efflux transporter [candidate division Zixibacteria bacterium]|nr:MATE family efflux transporter [candidate division Zixibacteria bacterium]